MNTSYQTISAAQKKFYLTEKTKPLAFRLAMLEKLRIAILRNQNTLIQAVGRDLHKSPTETYMTEIGILLDEIRYHQKHLAMWSKEKRVSTPISLFPSRCFSAPEPYGTVLIIAPWNYPIQLALMPLIGAISAGNCAVIKPSEYAPASALALEKLLHDTFPQEYITVVQGGIQETKMLLKQRFDYIFFTGSPAVGKVVMEEAAQHLTSVTLELGGKSPVIVDDTANLKLAARKIAFGKVLNAGQICIAPDYLLIDEKCLNEFLRYYRVALKRFSKDGNYTEMPYIINQKHFERLCSLMEGEQIAIGGQTDASRRFISPTVLVNVAEDSPIMQQEIFGPILPILTYRKKEDCIRFIQAREKPLALYIFSADKAYIRKVLSRCAFGGGCVNDVIMHAASNRLPFGGVGNAGMGAYHGKASYDTFTHWRGIVYGGQRLDIPLRYPPYSSLKDRIIRQFLK